jgi:hypothetical protein
LAIYSSTTTGFTAVAGNGYWIVTQHQQDLQLHYLQHLVQEIKFILVDYAGTFDTNPLVINPNGNKIESGTGNLQLGVEREGVTLTYIDSTQGWLATSGINEGTDALEPAPYSVDFLVVAGGGGGGGEYHGGAGGAGGYRTSTQTVTAGTAITVTVGDGGASTDSPDVLPGQGSSSSISGSGLTTITSAGGGYGGYYNYPSPGNSDEVMEVQVEEVLDTTVNLEQGAGGGTWHSIINNWFISNKRLAEVQVGSGNGTLVAGGTGGTVEVEELHHQAVPSGTPATPWNSKYWRWRWWCCSKLLALHQEQEVQECSYIKYA